MTDFNKTILHTAMENHNLTMEAMGAILGIDRDKTLMILAGADSLSPDHMRRLNVLLGANGEITTEDEIREMLKTDLQGTVAKNLGVASQTIRRIANGERAAGKEVATRLAKFKETGEPAGGLGIKVRPCARTVEAYQNMFGIEDAEMAKRLRVSPAALARLKETRRPLPLGAKAEFRVMLDYWRATGEALPLASTAENQPVEGPVVEEKKNVVFEPVHALPKASYLDAVLVGMCAFIAGMAVGAAFTGGF